MNKQALDLLYEEFCKDVSRLYPSLEISNSGSFSINDIFNTAELEFSINQEAIRNTVYTNGVGNQFIHFTSVENLFSILKEDSLRLYNLNLLNDPKEFNYLIDKYKLDFTEQQLSLFKRSLHLFSFCKYNDVFEETLEMWRAYGKDGEGVGIVFKLENEKWYNFLLGEIQYETNIEHEEKICALIEIANRYKKRGLNIDRMPIIFGKLLLFHKSKPWIAEREVRLSSFFEYNEYDFSPKLNFNSHWDSELLNIYPSKTGKIGSYISLELNHKLLARIAQFDEKERGKFLDLYPRFSIDKVIIGYRHSNESMSLIHRLIYKYNRSNGTNITPTSSTLRKYFT